ncbi:hypothetical protein N7466_001884 [Penicillium verhagenii]|uniref:uncharacterized protein n=1 Tax=Penicillium verhagenii TaxID=1562060 RepID=UPI002544D3DD|nr:uncharacterized protein N7466_001884 [Penicillium verhagenii]KAJ5938750.1 hypothetical protein N7466_001884 [Penicillium verhagenii]
MPPRKSNKEAGKSSKTTAGKSSKTSAKVAKTKSSVASTKGTKKTQDGVKKTKGTKKTEKTEKVQDEARPIPQEGAQPMTHPRYPYGRSLFGPGEMSEEEDGIPENSSEKEEIEEKPKRVWDPEKSYVGLVEVPELVRPKRKRWHHEGPPILDVLKVPADWLWNDKEYDLDDEDLDAQIQRCDERIEDGILPYIFEHKKKGLLESKEMKDKSMARFPGKSWNVVQRIEMLEIMQKYLEGTKDGDEYQQLANVKALLEAYKSGQLDWNAPGLVTYWSHGVQLCQPRPHDWDEFLEVNREHDGEEGFWMEGSRDPGPVPVMRYYGAQYYNSSRTGAGEGNAMTYYGLLVRIPGYHRHNTLEFMDDTGASVMTLTDNDVGLLQVAAAGEVGRNVRRPPAIGLTGVVTAEGNVMSRHVIMLEVNILDKETGQPVLPIWEKVEVLVNIAVPYQKPPPKTFWSLCEGKVLYCFDSGWDIGSLYWAK